MPRNVLITMPPPPPRMPMQAEGGFIDESPTCGTAGETLTGQTVEEVERELVLRTLAQHRGNRTSAARVLGISVRTLRNKIRSYQARGIAVPEHLPRRLDFLRLTRP